MPDDIARPRAPWRITRRRALAGGAAALGGAVGASLLPASVMRALAAGPGGAPAQLTDIEHVVILMQENRSFDHYFGTLSGVRGFSDPNASTTAGRSVFDQVDPAVGNNPSGHVLPFHLDTATTSAQCVHDLSHAWSVQHGSWNQGTNAGFVTSHRVGDDGFSAVNPAAPTNDGPLTMGYHTRADIPLHYALADAFTVCDAYHCSVFGPTNPNRISAMSGTTDPSGSMGGPCIDNSQNNGQLSWKSYPELLQAAGIDWYQYQEADCDTNNMLPLFAGFNDTTSDLYRRGNSIIPTPAGQPYGPALAAKLKSDVLSGNLPQVSWILASGADCEHPSASPAYGERFVGSILDALTADPAVWAKTALFYTFDENDGFFDHVIPPTPPPGTADEYLTAKGTASNPGSSFGIDGPVGLGFRVPMIVISPFSRGGYVCSDTFDHTSLLMFLERRFGVEVPYISAWRRQTCGDLTAAFNFAATPDASLPATLPSLSTLQQWQARADSECGTLPAPAVPATQSMPSQEPGTRPTPSGIVPPQTVPESPVSAALALAGGAVAIVSMALARHRTTTRPHHAAPTEEGER